MPRITLVLVALLFAGCARTSSNAPDAAGGPSDAAPAPAKEIVSGSGRVTGGGMTLDVEIGHPYSPRNITGGAFTIEGAAAVKP